jgi:hypothetical protein
LNRPSASLPPLWWPVSVQAMSIRLEGWRKTVGHSTGWPRFQ